MRDAQPMTDLQRKTALSGVVLLIISLLTGALLAGAMTGQVSPDVHSVVAAHMNAFLGCFWLCALAFTLPLLRFGEVGVGRLAMITVVANYANWAITLLKAFLHVSGVGATGEGKNDLVFVLLNIFVVVPSFTAAIAWAIALMPKSAKA